MIYEVSENKGEALRIGLTETGEGLFEVTIDGTTVHVDVVTSGPTIYSIIEDGQQFEAMVDEKGAHGFDVLVAGRIFHLESVDERTRLLAGSAKIATSGPQTVEAEMPGKVVKVIFEVGAEVVEGEGVLIIEAMKMENEILAPIDGVVKEVSVAEGDTVEAGTSLFTVDPHPEQESS